MAGRFPVIFKRYLWMGEPDSIWNFIKSPFLMREVQEAICMLVEGQKHVLK